MSTQPGLTSRPSASTVRAAAPRSRPTAVMRPSVMATSAVWPAAPVPSTTVPPLITTSCTRSPKPNVPPTLRRAVCYAQGVRALDGLRVIDLSNLFAGPQVAAILADYGADVVKVEPPAGDPLQHLGARRNGRSAPYALANRGKRVVRLDFDADQDALHALLDKADVVVTNQPMSVLRGWGADPDTVLARNPRAVVVTVSCFGTDGPWADRPGNGSLSEA